MSGECDGCFEKVEECICDKLISIEDREAFEKIEGNGYVVYRPKNYPGPIALDAIIKPVGEDNE